MFFWNYDPVDVGNLVSGSFAFSKSSLNIWKFSVHVLLKPSLEDFEHDLASMWNECNCVVVWPKMGRSWWRDLTECGPLEKGMANHFSILALKTPWTVWKGKGTRDQIANIHWIIEKAREFQKNIYFCFIDYAKALDCVDHNKLWKILKEIGIPSASWPASWEICMQVKKQQLEQLTGSKLGKKYVKAVYCHPAYLTYMQSTSCEMPGWMKHKLESRLLGEISITSDMQMIPPYGRKWRGTEELLDESERRVKKQA